MTSSRTPPGPWSVAVGREVRRLREEKGMSQLSLANLIEVHQGGLSKRESGKMMWETNLLAKTAQALGTTASAIVRAVEQGENAADLAAGVEAYRRGRDL